MFLYLNLRGSNLVCEVTEQTGTSLTWSETITASFIVTKPIDYDVPGSVQ